MISEYDIELEALAGILHCKVNLKGDLLGWGPDYAGRLGSSVINLIIHHVHLDLALFTVHSHVRPV